MARPLKICFAVSELSPLVKTGGLADVAAALPRQLRRLGHDVRVFVPLYSTADLRQRSIRRLDAIGEVPIQQGRRTHRVSFHALDHDGDEAAAHLVDCPELFHRPLLYTTDPDEPQRFGLLCRAVIECCQRLGWAPDVFHCNDWHAALVPLLLRTSYEWDRLFRASRTLVAIHNLGYQGVFPAAAIDELGLGSWRDRFDQDELRAGRIGFLRTGLQHADMISTVSPTYAREIQGEEHGMGLAGLLRARGDRLVGILNGVDYDEWSPETDRFIPHRYSAGDLAGKARNKADLLATLRLDSAGDRPLAGIVSRLSAQKGFELAFDVLPELLAGDRIRLVVLGQGEARYEDFFEQLQHRFPGRACFHRGFSDELAHRIEAASDLILMPSRYEPCGLNQLFSLRYGTVPVVRKTGGLADTVEPADEGGGGTGFVFEHFTPDGLRWALGRALDAYRDRERWARLVRNGMARDFSWDNQAPRYVELYRRIVGS